MNHHANKPVPPNLSPIVHKTLELVDANRRQVGDLAKRAGVTRNTFRNWRKHGGATVGGLEAVLKVMGYRLEVVPIENGVERVLE